MSKQRLLCTAAATAIFCQFNTGAVAQSSNQSILINDEVVVTATRREENLNDVPISVTAVTGEQIDAFRVQTITDLQTIAPNFAVSNVAAKPNDPIIQIRGLLQRASDSTLDTAVGVYSDEVFLARGYSVLGTLLDVERVEILRGPQGTLFGRNTIGGAIQVVSKTPEVGGELGGYISAGGGNYGLFETKAAIETPLGDRAAARFAGKWIRRNGYSTSYLVDDSGGYVDGVTPILDEVDTHDANSVALRGSFAYQLNDDAQLDISHYYSNHDTNGVLQVGINGDIGGGDGVITIPPLTAFGGRATSVARSQFNQQDNLYQAVTDVRPFAQSEVNITIAKFTYDFGDFGLKVIGSRATGDQSGAINTDGIVTPPEGLFFQSHGFLNSEVEQFTVEAQLAGTTGKLDWIGGLYYFEEEALDQNVIGRTDGPPYNAATTLVNVLAENDSASIYGSVAYDLIDNLKLRAGGRYTEDTKGFDGASTNGLGICVYTGLDAALGCSLVTERDFQNFTWDFSLDFTPVDGTLAYAKVGSGYRTGGISLNANSPETAVGFDEDKVISYELGLKTDLGERAHVNLTGFYVDYTNIQQNVLNTGDNSCIEVAPGTPNVIITCNLGDAESIGFELDGVWQVTDSLGFQFAGGYTDFSYETDTTVAVFTPKWSFSVVGVYDFNVVDKPARLMLSYKEAGDWTPNDSAANVELTTFEGHQLFDARVSVDLSDNLQASLWGKNLTKDEYFQSGVGAISAVFQLLSGVPAAPRTFGGDITLKF